MVTLEEVDGEFNLTVDYNECRQFCPACDRIEDAVVCLESYIFPTPLEWFLICLHLGLFTIGVVGNILVCFVVLRSKHMQTVTNLFIVNLAFADAVVLVVCSPPSVLQSVTETWFMGDIMCKMVIFLQTTVVSVSVLTLCAIAVERYFAICRPLKSRITLRKVTVTVLIIWVISAAMASPNLNNYVQEMFR
ncbi:orexin receptor type 1, partial [Biomphalaria pfeifferi]